MKVVSETAVRIAVEGQRDSSVGKVLALHACYQSLLHSAAYQTLSTTRNYLWVQSQESAPSVADVAQNKERKQKRIAMEPADSFFLRPFLNSRVLKSCSV